MASKEWNNFSCWQSFKEGADILGFLLRKATLDNGLCYWSPCQSKKTLRLRQILIYSWASSCRQINNHKQTWPIWLGFLTICQSHLLRGFWGVITESHVIRLGDQRRVERNTVNHLFCLQFCTIIVFSRCCNLQIYTTCFILSDNVAFNATQFFLWIALLVLLVKICWYGKFLWFLLSWFWRRTRIVQVHALCNVQCVKYILQIVKCIFPSCIFPNFRIYLSKLLNLFVQIVNWPAGAICSWHWLKLRPFIGAFLFDPRQSMKQMWALYSIVDVEFHVHLHFWRIKSFEESFHPYSEEELCGLHLLFAHRIVASYELWEIQRRCWKLWASWKSAPASSDETASVEIEPRIWLTLIRSRVWHSWKFWYEWMSEYIRMNKIPRMNIRIYSY